MTERLYYADSYCVRFPARVVGQLAWRGCPAVLLDRTAFYPSSGGQPADRGMLNGTLVCDVAAREEDGAVVHVLERELPVGAEVEGVVDWTRRFDHMQQHTGQHILSAAFERLLDADTVGFHLGADASTIDVAVAHLSHEAAEEVENMANRVVWENRPVSARFVSPDELAALPLRRPPAVREAVRVVEIGDPATELGRFDLNPCGGTHVARTGEIGLIKIVRLDYRGDQTRVEFLCGGRALRDYRAKNALVGRLTSQLTVGYGELDQAVERLQGEAKLLRQELRRARQQALQAEAAGLAEAAVGGRTCRVARQVWEQREPEALRALAQELARRPGLAALLAGIGERTHLCFACADDVEADMASLLRDVCARLGGKGGGQRRLAQGSAPPADPLRVREVLQAVDL